MRNFRIKSTRITIHIGYFGSMYRTLIESSVVEPVSVPNIENTQVSNSCKKFLVRFRKKANSKQYGFQHLSKPLSEKENEYKKYPG